MYKTSETVDFDEKNRSTWNWQELFRELRIHLRDQLVSFFVPFFFFFFSVLARPRSRADIARFSAVPPLWTLGALCWAPVSGSPSPPSGGPVEGLRTPHWTSSCRGDGRKGCEGRDEKDCASSFLSHCLGLVIWSSEGPCKVPASPPSARGRSASDTSTEQNRCSFYCTYCIYWDSLKEKRELYEE